MGNATLVGKLRMRSVRGSVGMRTVRFQAAPGEVSDIPTTAAGGEGGVAELA